MSQRGALQQAHLPGPDLSCVEYELLVLLGLCNGLRIGLSCGSKRDALPPQSHDQRRDEVQWVGRLELHLLLTDFALHREETKRNWPSRSLVHEELGDPMQFENGANCMLHVGNCEMHAKFWLLPPRLPLKHPKKEVPFACCCSAPTLNPPPNPTHAIAACQPRLPESHTCRVQPHSLVRNLRHRKSSLKPGKALSAWQKPRNCLRNEILQGLSRRNALGGRASPKANQHHPAQLAKPTAGNWPRPAAQKTQPQHNLSRSIGYATQELGQLHRQLAHVVLPFAATVLPSELNAVPPPPPPNRH